jgi:hypothetical protein
VKHRTDELEGKALDRAVAKACGWRVPVMLGGRVVLDDIEHPSDPSSLRLYSVVQYAPSTCWDHGGPIIDREKIATEFHVTVAHGAYWAASLRTGCGHIVERDGDDVMATGPTALIAAMRAFVKSKLGEEVEPP